MSSRHYLREWRVHSGLSLQDFADRIRLEAATVSRFETGTLAIPEEHIDKIAEALGIEVTDLFRKPS